MTEQRKKLIERFQKWLDTNPRKQIIAAECANIAEQYHKEQLMLANVVEQSEQFYCVSSDALVYGKPCKKWCGDEHCKALCKQ